MGSTFAILFPLFGLILAGYLCRKRDIIGPTGARELNRFVVWLALPALLFLAMVRSPIRTLYQPGFAASFGIASVAMYLVVLFWRRRSGRPLADASVDAVSATYSNTGFVGIPLASLAFGTGSLVASMIATVIVVCGLFAVAVVAIEVGLQGNARGPALGRQIGLSIVRNPLLVAPVLGVFVSCMGWTLPPAAESFLQLLGGASTPCALVGLGLFLAEKQSSDQSHALAWQLVAIKLLALPLLTWWLAAEVFRLPPLYAHLAILMAALPTGTGPFMLAEFYRREAVVTSRTTLWSTAFSLLTLSLLMPQIASAGG